MSATRAYEAGIVQSGVCPKLMARNRCNLIGMCFIVVTMSILILVLFMF